MFDALLDDFEDDVTRTTDEEEAFQKLPLDDIEDPSQTSEIRFDEAPLLGSPAVRMTYSDAVFVMARDLSALLKISTTINAIRDLDKLEKALLDLLFEVVPARRGAPRRPGPHQEPGGDGSGRRRS